jgi:hypothetical protein
VSETPASQADSVHLEDIKRLHEENIRLKKKIWKLQFSSTLTVGLSLVGAGAVSLAASYVTSSVMLTLAGLGLVFWGVIMLYISPQRYVPEKIFGSTAISMTKTIDKLLVSLNYSGRTIFLYPKHLKGLSQGYVFIPFELKEQNTLPSDEALAEERLIYENPRGIFMVAPSYGLVQLTEKEIDSNLINLSMTSVKEVLPKLFVNNLRLVDRMSIEETRGFVRATMEGESAANVCRAVTKETKVGEHFGCPLCSCLGLIISKVTGKPVSIEENTVNEVDFTITTTYKILEI